MKKYKIKKEKSTPLQAVKSIFAKIPQEVYTQPTLLLNCNGTMQIEHCKEILLYNENTILLNMGQVKIEIEGIELHMDNLEKGFMYINGKIFTLKYIYKE